MPEQRKRGRPTGYNLGIAARIIALAEQGKTDAQIAYEIGVSLSALSNWKAKHEDFKGALKDAKWVADELVEASLFQRAVGYSHRATKFFFDAKNGKVISQPYIEHHAPDTTACIFWLKNRQPEAWRDRHEIISVPESPDELGDKSFDEFCIAAGYPPPFPKQQEMRAFVFDPETKCSRLLLGARGYGKTDYATILGSAYKLYQDRQFRVLITTKSDEKNAAIVEEITKALQANSVELEKQNALHLRVRGVQGKDHSVSALTIGASSFRGRHPDLIIMDDPVTEEDVSEATRDRLQRKYNELVKLCQNIAIIGQPVHVFDLYETLRPLVKTMEVPHGTIPELDHDLEAMALAGVSEKSINASYHLRVTSEAGNPLSKVAFIDKFPKGGSVAFIDPSFRGGDYTAMSIGRQHFEGIAIQGHTWKKSWDDCLSEIVRACHIYDVKKLCFETNSLGMMPLKILREQLKHLGVSVVGKDSTGFKHSRIMAAGTFAHMIHLAKTSDRIYVQQTTKYEYGSKFDDAPDSLASLLEWIGLIRGKK